MYKELMLDDKMTRIDPVCNLCTLTMEWYTAKSKTVDFAGYICPNCEYSIITDIILHNENS